jgi:gliding-associated putative ABC transporter substrate-binding component GldG
MKKWSQRTLAIISCVLFAAILVGLNVILTNHNVRYDLTRDKRFSVSGDLRRLLGRMTDVLNVTLYVSGDLPPQLAVRQKYAEDMFRELSVASGGRLRLGVVNMTPEEIERRKEELDRYKIEPIQAQIQGQTEVSFREIYQHLLVQYADRSQVLMVPDQSDFEFQFGRALVKVLNEKKPHVVFIETGKGKGFLNTATALERNAGLGDLFRVTIVDGTDGKPLGIPGDADLVILSAPDAPLKDRQLYEIDQHLMYGGKLVVLAAGTDFTDQLIFFKDDSQLPNINKLLKHYGVLVDPELVQDWGSSLKAPMQGRQGNLVFQIMAPYPIFPIIERASMNTDYAALKLADRVALALASPVHADTMLPPDFTVTPLMRTTKMADTQTTAPYNLEHPKPTAKPAGETREITVALSVKGPFVSYFQGREIPPPSPPDPTNPFDQLRLQAAAQREFRPKAQSAPELIVIASPRAFQLDHLQVLAQVDQIAFSQTVTFLQNFIEGLTIGDDLANIRARKVSVDLLKPMSQEEKRKAVMLGTWVVPVVVAVFGALWTLLRRMSLARTGRQFAKGA